MVRVTARGVPGEVTLSRHRMRSGNATYRSAADSVAVAAGDSLVMSPSGVDLTAPVPSDQWHSGELTSFTLEFRSGGRVKVRALVVRPNSVLFR